MFNSQMKNLSLNTPLFQKSENGSQAFNKEEIPPNIIKCKYNNEVYQFCLNNKCKQYTFTCSNLRCLCNKTHQRCQKANIEFALKNIKQKISSTSQIKTIIDESIDAEVQKLSNLRQTVTSLIDQKNNAIYLTDIQRKFYQVFYHNQKSENLVSKDMITLWNNIDNVKAGTQQLILNLEKQIKNISNSITSIIDRSILSIHHTIDTFIAQKQSYKQHQQKTFKQANNSKPLQSKTLKKCFNSIHCLECKDPQKQHNSLFLDQPNQYQYVKILMPKPISKIHVVFKASLHNYNFNYCIQKCKQQKHLLIICRTQQAKLIAAFYTQSPKTYGLFGASKSTYKKLEFVFSLTNKQIIKVRSGKTNQNWFKYENTNIERDYFNICDKSYFDNQSFLFIDDNAYNDNLSLKNLQDPRINQNFSSKTINLFENQSKNISPPSIFTNQKPVFSGGLFGQNKSQHVQASVKGRQIGGNNKDNNLIKLTKNTNNQQLKKKLNKKYNGNQTDNFKITEWEIIRLEF